jgi:hypothetical protein
MKKIYTNNYIEKVAFLPSLTGVKDKLIQGVKGVQKAVEPLLEGTAWSSRGAVGRALDVSQSHGYSDVSGFAQQLKSQFDYEFKMHEKNPSAHPGKLISFLVEHAYCNSTQQRLTTNQSALTTNTTYFDPFMTALKTVSEYAVSIGSFSGSGDITRMIEAKDPFGNPHKDKEKMSNSLISIFGSWFPSYYNRCVDIMLTYNSSRSNPSPCTPSPRTP